MARVKVMLLGPLKEKAGVDVIYEEGNTVREIVDKLLLREDIKKLEYLFNKEPSDVNPFPHVVLYINKKEVFARRKEDMERPVNEDDELLIVPFLHFI